MKSTYILAAALAVLGLTAQAQKLDRSKLPADAPAPTIKVGQPTSFTLANGLKVFVVQNNKLPRVAVNLLLDYEPILEGDKAGYVSIAGDLMRTGTKTRSKDQLDEEVDFIGATLSTSPTGLYASSLKKHLPKLMELTADVLLNPNFTQAELDKLKKQNKSALASAKDNPNAIANRVGAMLVYGKNHPYGEPDTEQTIDNITLEDCRKFYETYYRPNVGYLAVVGDITPAEARTMVEKYFGNWKRGEVPAPTYEIPKAPEKTKVVIVDKPSAVQSIVHVQYPVVLKPYTDESIRASIANDILGGGEARLFNNLREKRGFTYGAYSSLSSDRLVGRFRATASVRNAVTDSAVAEFMNELKAIRSSKPTAEELSRTKSAFAGNFIFSLENPQTIANFAISTARYNLPQDFFANYLKKIDAVTDADVQQVATQLVKPENAYIMVVGKASEIAEKLKKFGPLEFYDVNGNKVEAPAAAASAAQSAPGRTSTSASAAGMTAQQVIDKYLTAIGGKEALSKINDLTISMTTEMQGQTMEMVRKAKSPNKSSMVVYAMGMEAMKMVSDGQKVSRTARGNTSVLEGKEAQQVLLSNGLFPEMNFAANGVKSTLQGTEKIEGKDAYVVAHASADGAVTWTDFYDVATGLKVQTVTVGRGRQGDQEQVVKVGDYKVVNGVKIPHTIRQNFGPMEMTLSVNKVDVNKGLKDSDFKVN
ncbi:insulinase family protein [Tellurirhabdus rosea]|uniref:insulinase family protein n=1 Tax=Tellurirhabdus rosea TaxID=2674997 RepID=UPI00225C1113|nr:insulinase family protein [Tellurirhabdus rosea]